MMKTKLKLHLLLLALLSLSGFAHAQGTAISYQGRLNDGGLPATGLYDFTFHVFDAEVDGTDLAGPLGPLPYDAVPVTNGVFNVILDFGPDIFTGAARWLEITVRTNGVGDPSLLSPRTPLLPTPYAIFAGKAGGVASGTVTADQLNSGGVPPTPGQFLSYDGGNFLWSDPDVLVGNVWSRNGTGDAYYNAGKVGIGTSGPLTPLEVIGPVRSTRISGLPQYIQLNGGDSGSIKLTAQSNLDAEKNLFIENLSGQATPGANNNIQFVLGTTSSRSTKMTINRDGYVGIGTVNPTRNLHLYDPNSSVTQLIETGGGLNAWSQTRFKNGNGEWVMGTSRDFNSDEFYVNRLGSPVNLFAIDASGLAARFATADLRLGHPLRRGTPGRALVDFTTTLHVNFAGDWATTEIGGTTTYIDGDASVKTLTIRGGADVAEPFAMPEEIAKGSVMVIDDAHPGQLKLSSEAYDTRVAGIVSGANGINPGIALHQEGVVEGGQNVALSGRVYVQADATSGAIKPGDLLTTSDTPGHAMKVTEHSKAQGAILGKAMSGLKAGKGMVLVLVTLQ
jgi:hypothetical protein